MNQHHEILPKSLQEALSGDYIPEYAIDGTRLKSHSHLDDSNGEDKMDGGRHGSCRESDEERKRMADIGGKVCSFRPSIVKIKKQMTVGCPHLPNLRSDI